MCYSVLKLRAQLKRKSFFIPAILLSAFFVSVRPQPADILMEDGEAVSIPLLNYSVITSPGRVVEEFIVVAPSSTVAVNVIDIPVDGAFVLLQAHAYQYEIVLSYNRILTPHSFVNGTNIGLIQETNGKMAAQFFIHNTNELTNITILVAAQAYGADAPVPGGCNMEFAVEIAPYLRVTETESVVVVDSQPPALSALAQDCEFALPPDVLMYHMYLPEIDFSSETYFEALRAMMTVQALKDHGILTEPAMVGSSLRRTYNAYRGTGTVYGAIAVSGFSSSAYVPAVTYGCNGQTAVDSCEVLSTVFSRVLCAVTFFLGVFTCFFGHKFFRTEMFLAGFLDGWIVSYILLSLQNTLTTSVVETVSVILGLVFGAVWLFLWFCFGVPLISILLPSMTFGFLIASVSMYAALADVQELENDANFWAAFVCIMLVVPLVCPPVMSKSNMLICAVLGGYATIFPVDYYIGSNLKYIIVNTIRRATVSGYNVAVIEPPFQFRDIILVAMWLSLSVLGFTAQLWQQKGKPPFPPPPYRSRYRQLMERTLSSQTPLLIDARVPYGTTTEAETSTERRFTFLPKMPRVSLPVEKV